MSTKVQGRKIAIIGASGQLGKPTIEALTALGGHTITAIQREGATSQFPAEIIVKNGNLKDEDFLADVLRGQDALVLMPPLSHLNELQKPAIRAAAKVAVPYVFPSEFGPDPYAGELTEENVLLRTKKSIRDLIEELGVSNWVSIAVGPWFEYGLAAGLWGIDIKAKKATIWPGAEGKANTATVAHTAEALAATLSLPEKDLAEYKNKAVYAPSFCLTQREMLQVAQRATGTSDVDWDIQVRSTQEMAQEYEEKISQGDGAALFVKFFVTHFLKGHGGDFNHKVDAAELAKLEKLGLGKEDVYEAAKKAL